MSKERLEKIKESLVKLHNAIDIDDETKDYIFNDLRIEWLIERVQELEETNKKNYWIASDFKYENLVLEQQNKRLRKALEEIKSHQVVGVANWGIEYAKLQKIAHEALEGE